MAGDEQRLNAKISIGSVLEKSLKKNVGVIRSGMASVGAEIGKVTERQRELDKQRKVLVRQGQSVDHLDREYEDLSRTLERLTRQQKRWQDAQRASARVGSAWNDATASVGRTARRSAMAVGAAGAAIFATANSTASLGDEVAKNARKFGIGIEAYQELRYAAERSGVSVSTFDSSFTAFTKRLGEAADDTGPAADAIKDLGLNVDALVSMAPEEAFGAIADRLSDVESPARRAALASALFSRAGVGMVNMLGDGSDALDQLRRDARATGYVLSEEATRDAEAFQDRLLDAQLVVKGLKNTFGAELMPVVTEAMGDFSAWARQNRGDVTDMAEAAVDGLERALPVIGEVASGMGTVSGHVRTMTGDLADLVGGWENLGVVIGATLVSGTIVKVGRLVWSVAQLGWTVGRAVAGMASLAKTGTSAWSKLGTVAKRSPLLASVSFLAQMPGEIRRNWDGIGTWFGSVWGNASEAAEGAVGSISALVRGDLSTAASEAKRVWSGATGLVSDSWDALGANMALVWRTQIKPVLDLFGVTDEVVGAWTTARQKVGALWGQLGSAASGLWDDVRPLVDGLSEAPAAIASAWERLKSGIGSVLDAIGSKFGALWERVKGPIEAMSSVGGVVSRFLPGGEGSPRGTSDVQSRAAGGYFRPGELLVGEKGPERRYEDASGYIAHHRRLRELAGLSDRAASGSERIAAAAQAQPAQSGGGSERIAPAAQSRPAQSGGGSVVQNITINAAGTSAAEVADEIDRRRRAAERSSLFDRADGFGGALG